VLDKFIAVTFWGVWANALPIYFFYLRIIFLAVELKEEKQKRLG
jgi:hypothetical protein